MSELIVKRGHRGSDVAIYAIVSRRFLFFAETVESLTYTRDLILQIELVSCSSKYRV